MRRRDFLRVGGAGLATLAGCASGTGDEGGSGNADAPYEHPGTLETSFAANGDYPPNETPADGYPPEFPDPPAAPTVDPSTFETLDVNGETVPLAPIDVVATWYLRSEARFVDARGLTQYERAHVYGSVLSTAQKGSKGGGIDDWPTDTTIVTYCGCPHHLSSLRAAGLSKAGYTEVYALDEGFGAWSERGYPMAGTSFRSGSSSDLSEWTIEGVVDDRYAGEYAWAAAGRQYEAAPIRANGEFTLHLRFADVTGETRIAVSTPAFSVTKPLSELEEGVVDG